MHMRDLLERMILPMIAAQAVRFFFKTPYTSCNRFGGTQSNKPPLVCASASRRRSDSECCSNPQWHLLFRDFVLSRREHSLRDERENFAADQRHFCGDDFCTDAAGTTHRGEMSSKPKPVTSTAARIKPSSASSAPTMFSWHISVIVSSSARHSLARV